MEGILEVLNDPPKGYKEFCGRIIEANFQHVAETVFSYHPHQNEDNESIAVSILEDDYPQVGMNVQRI